MDLSKLRWPVVILIIAGFIWLVSSPGMRFFYERYANAPVGQSAEEDRKNEAGLSWVGGFLLRTLRYEFADEVLTFAVEVYPNGENRLANEYKLSIVANRLGDYQRSVDILHELSRLNASTIDDRVPGNDRLNADALKLVEIHDLRD